ncbi:hypothetical protein OHC33_001683 [Knufia fluminis]|uniref:Uncharacterized protein n=1 Tax=Knufia fluminis TaxID=191047 RepID=A0AAN8FF42_9EURO|nr:hypothetical protein OHC33_001683 [Knufia fluminis]
MASYSLPLPSSQASQQTPRKRKRKPTIEESGVSRDEHMLDGAAENTEYSAAITPEERLQRRLAGQPLNEPPPPFPFPHASLPQSPPSPRLSVYSPVGQASSLRSQHLSAMTTLLHKCLQAKDYKRASRALGLILRTETRGRPIDLRHGGLWGIGAEILLRTPSDTRGGSVAREGFERAKTFYDKIALQHPWHRTWPNMTNAQDFKLAMFGLWIFVTCLESKKLQLTSNEAGSENGRDTSDIQLQAKRYELAEAERIAQEMDTLMSTIPFIDDPELTRLRAHVASWTADLLEKVDELEMEVQSDHSRQEQQMEQAWLGIAETEEPATARPPNSKVANARQLASTLLAKLGGSRVDEDSDANDDFMGGSESGS